MNSFISVPTHNELWDLSSNAIAYISLCQLTEMYVIKHHYGKVIILLCEYVEVCIVGVCVNL